MYTTPELPDLIGTAAQVSYAVDIRAGQIRSIQDRLPDGTPATGRPFRQRVIEHLARYLSPSKQEVDRVLSFPGVDEAIQDTINAILGAKQAKNIIENARKKGTISERVASGAAKRMGWIDV
jgi:hypothetical protein